MRRQKRSCIHHLTSLILHVLMYKEDCLRTEIAIAGLMYHGCLGQTIRCHRRGRTHAECVDLGGSRLDV